MKYVQGKYVVIKSSAPSVNIGDIVTKVDTKPTTSWEDSLRHYYSHGNLSVFRRQVADHMLSRTSLGQGVQLEIIDSSGITHTVSVLCNNPYSYTDFFYTTYYPTDSLKDISWTSLHCDIGYVNMGVIVDVQVDSMYNDLRSKDAIIFDLRQNPKHTGHTIVNKLCSSPNYFTKNAFPDVQYPGTCFWNSEVAGYAGNPTPYTGKVILLLNEHTQSIGEYTSMMFETLPNVVKVGSQTAGADGDVSYWKASTDIHVGFSTVGVYYPNGDSTQRIGIVPDSIAQPSIAGIRRHRDEVLEKALTIAGCDVFLNASNISTVAPSIDIYPNPANETVTIDISGKSTRQEALVSIADISGKVMLQVTVAQARNTIDIHQLPPGMYFVTVRTDTDNYVSKLVKE